MTRGGPSHRGVDLHERPSRVRVTCVRTGSLPAALGIFESDVHGALLSALGSFALMGGCESSMFQTCAAGSLPISAAERAANALI